MTGWSPLRLFSAFSAPNAVSSVFASSNLGKRCESQTELGAKEKARFWAGLIQDWKDETIAFE